MAYCLDTPLSFVSRCPCVWYVGHSRSETNKRSTDSKLGATGGNYRPIFGRSLVSILESGEKRLRLSSLVIIPSQRNASDRCQQLVLRYYIIIHACVFVAVQKAVSVLSDNADADGASDVKTPLLNPVIMSMLSLPLLQIISLPQPATDHCDGRQTVRDCRTTSRHLLSVVSHYAHQHLRPCHHGSASTSALLILPTVVSQTCDAYVHLARRLSAYLYGNLDVDDIIVVGEWLLQVHGSLSASHQPSLLLTLLVSSVFVIHDDAATLDKCLQLLLAICQSDKTQVCL